MGELSCSVQECNQRKGERMPEEVGMPLKKTKKTKSNTLLQKYVKERQIDWRPYLFMSLLVNRYGRKEKLRVLSGIQPTGELHLGNYFGMMSRMIEYQNNSDLFCCIVNYHALTTIQDKNILKNNTINAAIDFLALGMDPQKSTFWIQSDIPQVAELTWFCQI